MTLEEAIQDVLVLAEHNRSYVYAATPFTPSSPAFIEMSASLGWGDERSNGELPAGVEIVAYVKDMRMNFLQFGTTDKVIEFYAERWKDFRYTNFGGQR